MAMFGNLSTMGQVSGGFSFDPETFPTLLEDFKVDIAQTLEENTKLRDEQYEELMSFYGELDKQRKENLASFNQTYNSFSASEKKKYLWTMYDSGELTKDEYKSEVNNAYLTEAQNNANRGIYTGYIPYEYEGKTLFVEAKHLNPEVALDSEDFVRDSVLPTDAFYFPDAEYYEPNTGVLGSHEKAWFVGEPTINDVHKITNRSEFEFAGAGSDREARDILIPDKNFGQFIAPALNIIGSITKNPIFTAVGTKLGGGDAKDFIKTQVGSLFLQDVLPSDLLETELGDWGIDADLFGIDPEEWTEGMEKVQKGATKGKSIQDGLEKEFGVDILGNVIQGTVDIGTGVAGELMMEGDALVANINEFVIEPLEETFDAFAKTETGQGIQQVVDVATDAYEKAKDLGQDIIDPIDTVLDVVGEKVVDPTLQAGKAVGEAIIDPVDTVLDTFGEKVVDPFLQAGSDVLSAGEDVVKDVGRGLDKILDYTDVFSKGADLVTTPEFKLDVLRTPPTAQTKTQTEDLFSKELFEFDLKEQDEFSQEMLSPIMNLRRYG